MTARPIPEGYRAVTPYLFVESAERLLTFVKHAFAATEVLRVPRPDGSIMHAEVCIGDCRIMIGDVTGPAAEIGPMPSSIYLYVSDCDAVYQQAIMAGGVSIKAVQDIPFNGERYGGVRDPVGNIWWIATHVRDVTREAMMQRLSSAAAATETI